MFIRKKITHFDVITHLRDALSHPTILDLDSDYVSTGYTTLDPDRGEITKFAFVSSPDVRRGHPKYYDDRTAAQLQLKESGYPSDKYIKELNNAGIKYQIWSKDSPYVRVFQIDISIDCIKTLFTGLSNHLAQPVLPDWDGITT